MSKRSAEENLRAAATIVERLVSQATLEAGAAELFSGLVTELGVERAEVAMPGPDGAIVRCGEAGPPPVLIAGVLDADALGRSVQVKDGVAVFPLVAGSRVEGALAVRGALDGGLEAALSLVASSFALFLARRRVDTAESELRKREKELKIILDSVPAMIFFKDAHNRILRANRMAAEQAGVTPELMEGRTTEEFYPEYAARYLADDREVIRSEQPKLGIVEPHPTASGEKLWVRTDKVPYRDESGAVTGVVVFATDISPLKRAEEALGAEKQRLEITLRSIADAVIATDERGCVALLNPVAEKLTGWTLAEARGLPLDLVARITSGGARATLTSRAGERHSVTESRAPIREGADVVGQVVVLHDVTETLRLEEELFKVAKMESIGLLAAGIAHDFNNILTVVAANASLARASLGPASSALPLLDEVERAVKQARDLTFQLLTFAKGGAPTRERAALADLVRDGATLAIRGSRARLVLELAPDLAPADVDRGQFAQVIQNLVINATQAMAEGGVVAIRGENVALDAARARALQVAEGLYVKLSIEDTGAGIDREHLSKIFDPFFTTKAGGTGLGLTTTYSIVRRHQGAITCESQLGVGTRFDIFLPVSRTMPRAAKPPSGPLSLEGPPVSGRALVMDDQRTVRDVLGRMLERLGLACAFAADGEQAVRLYEEALHAGRRFDIVFMDLTIPGGMGGKDAVQHVLALDRSARVIVSSGYSNDPVMAEHERYGFCGLLAKPFALDEVAKIVKRELAGRV